MALGRLLVGQGGYPRSGMKSAPPAGIIGFPGAAVGAIPFVFPFAPLGLGLFDTDPQRLLSLLHHQSALAEEALRYRSLLFGATADSGNLSTGTQPPLLDDCKEPLDLHANTTGSTTAGAASFEFPLEKTSKLGVAASAAISPKPTMIRVRDGLTKEGFRNGGGEELLLRKPPPPPPPAPPTAPVASSSSSSSGDEPLSLFRDVGPGGSPTPTTSASTTGADTAKCHICMANFPSAWLLEQHSALQHPHLTIHDDKPYLCGLCGQKSRYACCRYRTVLAKHQRTEPGGRSRVPADKLFTCDVCGMQFRYLKSFKKHRLNHALERLHGKKSGGGGGGSGTGQPPADSEPAVSSTNEGGEGIPGSAASSAMVADLRSLTAQQGEVEGAMLGQGGEKPTGGEEQDDTVSDTALLSTPAADSAPVADDAQLKITSSSGSNSNSSSASSVICHSNGIAHSHPSTTNGGSRVVPSPMEAAANEALLTGELKRYQAASVAAVAAAAAQHHHHHHHAVRSMEAESSGVTGGSNAAASSATGASVPQQPHGLSPPTGGTNSGGSSSTGSSTLSHTLNSLINAETIPHHQAPIV
uniref:C2H2-type domain-containing protein n=1 Tax=Anopheles epiroticus TaxID=199890 RepID=A0A182P7X9_9DIPT